jgi:hypothetical protein
LESRPAFTAAAIKALAYPETGESFSPIGIVHSLGAELAGLNFVGENPFSGLGWLLPEKDSLFERIGAGPHVAVNLLLSKGDIKAGRHGEMIGPRGRLRSFTRWHRRRPLEEELRALYDVGDEVMKELLESVAADFDAVLAAIETEEIDLLLLRVASLDLATHGGFLAASRAGQDDAAPPLFTFYRYVDRRLGEVQASLDADDLLVVMSDHGILTGMEHDPRCLFVAVGEGVPVGRAPGMPPLRGIPRLLAELLGVGTSWPESGMEGWPLDDGGSL